ncbi:MAG TPA: type II secretion system F family protein [Dehalococcoidia bacterium]|nr:type II secretion system F family protein [Dehalococcoidia bacterium]
MGLLIIIALLIVAAVLALTFAVFGRSEGSPRIGRLMQYRSDAEAETVDLDQTVLRSEVESQRGPFSRYFGRMKGAEAMQEELEKAGLPLRASEFYMIRYAAAVVGFLAAILLLRSATGVVLGVPFGMGAFFIPGIYVRLKKRSRMRKIDSQLGELLTFVSNSLKAGYGLMQGLEFASRQLRDPIAEEIRHTLRDASLGMAAEESINGLGRRLESADMDMVVTAINIQRSVGGNLAEILDNVAFTMRERQRIRGEIRTLTAQQQISGYIVCALPIFVGAAFFLLNPSYISLLFTESLGRVMLAIAAGLQVLGIVIIRRIVNIEV